MLKRLREMITGNFVKSVEGTEEREHALRLATATLLVEVVRADQEEAVVEEEVVLKQLGNFFDLSKEETSLLVQAAEQEADYAVSLQSFTRELHENLTIKEKHVVIEMLWRVALADSQLDKYEDYLVRKVADLLYVPHQDLIRIRNRVSDDLA
ncbi:MAG: hypothetical protein CMD70_08505 [Gammaproteobacteria bacterium]|jgi:uncharacterized tellurite resistance protein B-like protein|nr:hypothetical protein [Gammaproteobacteria bacterium]|tara:strand:+ start:1524 stop:1982 length:459 start_codon:yes stop_codon:yes gene_type:complete